MKRFLILGHLWPLAIISFMLIIIVILAGIYLSPYPKDQNLALQLRQKIESSISQAGLDHDQSSMSNITEYPILDGQIETAILLEMSLPQLGEQVDFALTTQAIEFELSKHHNLSDQVICSEETTPSRQADVPTTKTANQTPRWQYLVNWVNLSSFTYQYQVALWHQSDQVEQYMLTADNSQKPSPDRLAPVTVICQDRT